MPYFWIYILFVLFSTSCNGVRRELMPQYNSMLGELSKPAKEAYLELRNLLDDEDKVKLQEQIGQIKQVKVLEDFIYKRLENQKKYNEVLKLLPRSDQIKLKGQFAECNTLDGRKSALNEYSKPFEMIQQVDALTKQHYIDLIALLSDDQATAFKNEVIQFNDAQKVVERIASKFCNVFGELEEGIKNRLSKLEDDERQDILRSVMQPNDTKDGSSIHTEKEQPSKVQSSNKPIGPNVPNDDHTTIALSAIDKLIEQKVKDKQEQKKKNEAIPKDEWGDKLSLIKEKKNETEFLSWVMQFDEADQKILKELFYKVVPDSLNKFFTVFFDGFNGEEHMQLLATMIYLYQIAPLLTIKLCNAPQSLKTWEKYKVYNRTTKNQLRLLTKLDDLLKKPKS